MKLARRTEPIEDDDWPPRRLRGVRVLVVDDDPDERDFLVALLGAAAAEVRSAASTAEALYTITRLMHTSSSVAVNSTLSLLSFRAILRVSDVDRARWTVSMAQEARPELRR